MDTHILRVDASHPQSVREGRVPRLQGETKYPQPGCWRAGADDDTHGSNRHTRLKSRGGRGTCAEFKDNEEPPARAGSVCHHLHNVDCGVLLHAGNALRSGGCAAVRARLALAGKHFPIHALWIVNSQTNKPKENTMKTLVSIAWGFFGSGLIEQIRRTNEILKVQVFSSLMLSKTMPGLDFFNGRREKNERDGFGNLLSESLQR